MSSPFKATFYTVDELNYHPVKCAWKFIHDPSESIPQDQIIKLFPQGCSLPTGKDISFPQDNSIELNFFYEGSTQVFGKISVLYRFLS